MSHYARIPHPPPPPAGQASDKDFVPNEDGACPAGPAQPRPRGAPHEAVRPAPCDNSRTGYTSRPEFEFT